MSLTPEEIAIIDAKMDTLTELDLPPDPVETPAMDTITTAVVTVICNQMKLPGGIHSAIGFVRKARIDYNRRFSIDQMQYVIDKWKTRISEIYTETHPSLLASVKKEKIK